MSLINDALKKAQRQRTGEAPPLASLPSVGGESAHRIAKRAKPAGFNTLMIRAGIGAGVVLVLAIGGWLVLREKPETGNLKPEVVGSNQASAPNVGSPLVGGPSPSANPQVSGFRSQVSEPPAAAPSFTLPTAPKPEPIVSKVEPPKPVAQQPVQPAASNPQVSGLKSQVSLPGDRPGQTPGLQQQTTVPLPKLEPRAINFIENIKVAGIMARAADAKVLMNDRVYRVGSVVEAEMGLRLIEITSGSLTFEDERGGRYTRTF